MSGIDHHRVLRGALWLAVGGAVLFSAFASAEETLVLQSAREVTQPDQRSHRGPWGVFHVKDVTLEPPMDKVDVAAWRHPGTVWYFGHHTTGTIARYFAEVGVLPDLLDNLVSTVRPAEGKPGVLVYPSDALMLRFPYRVRHLIYHELSRFPENAMYREPLWIPGNDIEYWLDRRYLNEDALGCLNDLLYPHEGFWMLSDVDVLLRCIPEEPGQREVLRMLLRHVSREAAVTVPPDDSLEDVIRYWRHPPEMTNENQRIRTVLAQAQQSGASVPLTELLPPMPRHVLNRYVAETGDEFRDCHWTALNFFNHRLVEFEASPEAIRAYLLEHFRAVDGPPAFGDVVVLRNKRQDVIHSFNYIAANKVFTKNGGADDRPWTLMPMDEVIAVYSLFEPVDAYVFRRKDMMPDAP